MLIEKILVSKSFLIRNKTYFTKKGYDVNNLTNDIKQEDFNNDIIEIDVKDLSFGSKTLVSYYCDYCNSKEVLHTSYKNYITRRKIIAKDACHSCAILKAKECSSKKYSKQELELKQKQKSDKLKRHWESYTKEEVENIVNNRKNTCLSKYGVDNPFKSNDIKEKTKQTLLELYKVDNCSKNEDIKNKKKQTYFNKTGYYNPQQNPEALENKRLRCLENYGVEHHGQRHDLVLRSYEKFCKYFSDNNKTLLLSFEDFYNRKHIKEYELKLICNVCNNEYYQSPFNLNINNLNKFKDYCPTCNPSLLGGSLQEASMFNWISTIEKDVQPHNRKILDRKEIDIFLPSKNIGFEYNGLFWHSDNFKGHTKYTHKNKQDKAKEHGIALYFIYDFEWLEKTEIVKSIIKNKLNICDNKLFARKCTLKLLQYTEAKQFYEFNHIQGGNIIDSKMISIGLYFNDILYSCITLGRPRFNKKYEWELIRFANMINTQIVGGFSKMLKHFETLYKPKNILTYSDARLFQNNVYENAGFKYIETTDPNYFYIKNGQYVGSRYKFQKHKLKHILNVFDESLTEWENMINNGYDRVWDCGNRVFVKEYNV